MRKLPELGADCQGLDRNERVMMNREDLRALIELGRALWADPRESDLATVETLSAITLLDLTPDRALERAASALLERVRNRGLAADTRASLSVGAGDPFFRLYPEERMLLVSLHLGRWSYARLSRIFGISARQIEEMGWRARIELVSALPAANYPAGAPSRGSRCPEYDSKRPWTQRFLDEEIPSGRERIFLQNHLMACESCRGALARCRELYYAIDRVLPRLNQSGGDDGVLRSLEAIARRGSLLKSPTQRSFAETLEIFTRRPGVRWALSVLAALVIWRIFRR